jgi:Uma2 family endonuclease
MLEQKSHFRTLACLYSSLQALFGQRSDVYVAAQTPLHYDEAHPTLHKSPDLMVLQGVPNGQERDTIKVWEEVTPAIVVEITSHATWLEDLVNKSSLYLRLGVKEYIIFDPYNEFLKEGLQGLRLANGEYVPIPIDAKGMLTSEVLGANLVRQGSLLRLVHLETEALIPWGAELAGAQGDQSVQVVHETQQQVAAEAQRAQKESERAARESKRAQALEAENAHLRVLLGQMQSAPHR